MDSACQFSSYKRFVCSIDFNNGNTKCTTRYKSQQSSAIVFIKKTQSKQTIHG